MDRSFRVLLAVVLTFCLPAIPMLGTADAAPPAKSGAGPAAAAAQPGVVKYSPKMSAGALAGRPDTDIVELSDGRRIRLGDVRRLRTAAAKLGAPSSKLPPGLRTKPAATGKTLATRADLADALKRPDADTVVLPSGQRITVGMIRFLKPEIEKKTGRPITGAPARADRSGPAVKVTATSDWKSILKMPDGTVLESPNGARISVGALKTALAARFGRPGVPPAKR